MEKKIKIGYFKITKISVDGIISRTVTFMNFKEIERIYQLVV